MQPIDGHILVRAQNERTTLNRTTGELTSTVDITLLNLGGRDLLAPLHAVIETSSDQVTVPGALGGPADPVHHAYYLDVSGKLTDARLRSGASASFPLTLVRDRAVEFTYVVVPYALVETNLPPSIAIDPVAYQVTEGATLTFAVAASDPDGEVVSLRGSPTISNATFAAVSGMDASGAFTFIPALNQQGMYTVRFTATDPGGLTASRTVTIEVADLNRPPALSVPAEATVSEGDLLTLSATGTDPDGDPLEFSAGPLPTHSVFVADTGVFTFAPDFEQAGGYDIAVAASDGQASSPTQTLHVTVVDVPEDTGGTNELTLVVDPVESPTFLTRQHITGTVNASGGPPPRQPSRSALINSLSPSNGKQGEMIEVTLAGQSGGTFAPAFSNGVSRARFGPGITVNRLSIISPTEASAAIAISPDAAPGPRQVMIDTGNEVAIATVGFQVAEGDVTIDGTIVDQDSTNAVAGARITVQGTGYSTTSGADGSFALTGLAPGAYTLIVNPPNHTPVRLDIDAGAGQHVALGDLPTQPTVFDPNAPASVSLLSVMGRGAGDVIGGKEIGDLEQTITDVMLLVGGDEAGVLDEFGQQQNPAITGEGVVSLTRDGTRRLAERLDHGQQIFRLGDILFMLSFSHTWDPGGPPDLNEWLELLQDQVDAAWADPADPGHYLPIVMFGRGQSLNDPPVLSAETRLNPLQAFLFVSSVWTYITELNQGLAAPPAPAPARPFTGEAAPLTGATPASNKRYTAFWRGFHSARGNFVQQNFNVAYMNFAMAMYGQMFGSFGGLAGVLTATSFTANVGGLAADRLAKTYRVVNISDNQVPDPPTIVTPIVDTPERGLPTVEIVFHLSPSQIGKTQAPKNEADHGVNRTFAYGLYRYRSAESTRELVDYAVIGPTTPARTEGITIEDLPDEELPGLVFSLYDQSPLPMESDGQGNLVPAASASWIYTLLAVNPVNAKDMVDDKYLVDAAPWWSLPLQGRVDGLDPYVRRDYPRVSDYSEPALVTIDPNGLAVHREIEVSPASGDTFYLDRETQEIGGIENFTFAKYPFTSTGFKGPGATGYPPGGPQGLAVDSLGNLYSENVASDSQYGGKVFRFHAGTGAKSWIGAINYFSQVLFFANPAQGGPMDVGPGMTPTYSAEDVYIVDRLARQVKKIPVQAPDAVLPNRRVGQPFADIPFQARSVDLESTRNGDAAVLVERFTAPILVGDFALADGSIGVGDSVSATFKVTNPGTAPISGVTPLPLVIQGNGLVAVQTSPPAPVNLPGGSSVTFTSVYVALESGELRLFAQAQGLDSAGHTVSSFLDPPAGALLTITSPLRILSIEGDPDRRPPGGRFDVTMELLNTGTRGLRNVEPVIESAPPRVEVARTGTVSQVSAAAPTGFSLDAGERRTVTAAYTAGAYGEIAFKGSATAVNEDDEAVKAVPRVSDAVSVTPLDFSITLNPPTIRNEPTNSMQVLVTVTNIGQEALHAVTPTVVDRPVFLSAVTAENTTSAFAIFSQPIPDAVDLAPGAVHTFEFTASVPLRSGSRAFIGTLAAVTDGGQALTSLAETAYGVIGPVIRGRITDYRPLVRPDIQGIIKKDFGVAGLEVRARKYGSDPAAAEYYSAVTDGDGTYRIPVPSADVYVVTSVKRITNIGFTRTVDVLDQEGVLDVTLPISMVDDTLALVEDLKVLKLKIPDLEVLKPPGASEDYLIFSYELRSVEQFLNQIRQGEKTPRFRGTFTGGANGRDPDQWDSLMRVEMTLAFLKKRFDDVSPMAYTMVRNIVTLAVGKYMDAAQKRNEDRLNEAGSEYTGRKYGSSEINRLREEGSGTEADRREQYNRDIDRRDAQAGVYKTATKAFISVFKDQIEYAAEKGAEVLGGRPLTPAEKKLVRDRATKQLDFLFTQMMNVFTKKSLSELAKSAVVGVISAELAYFLVDNYVFETQIVLNKAMTLAHDPLNSVRGPSARALSHVTELDKHISATLSEYKSRFEKFTFVQSGLNDGAGLEKNLLNAFSPTTDAAVAEGRGLVSGYIGKLGDVIALAGFPEQFIQVTILEPGNVCRAKDMAFANPSTVIVENDAEALACFLITLP